MHSIHLRRNNEKSIRYYATNKDEINKAIDDISRELKELSQKIVYSQEKEMDIKFLTNLKTLNSRLVYIDEFFIEHVVFESSNNVDNFWKDTAKKFALSLYRFNDNCISLKEFTKFIVNLDLNKDCEFIDSFRKYNNEDIDRVLDYPEKTKNAFFHVDFPFVFYFKKSLSIFETIFLKTSPRSS